MLDRRIVILGAGPTGLGAAYRLRQLGHRAFHVYDAHETVGGLARSVRDPAGFLWDLGGHVLDSRFDYFDEFLADVLGDRWSVRPRSTFVRLEERDVGYPVQYHLRHLSPASRERCAEALLAAAARGRPSTSGSLHEWLVASFGRPLCDLFMFPYNRKVWACDLNALDSCWVRDRVARVSVGEVLDDLAGRDTPAWGPTTLRFPERGGTGALWEATADAIGRDVISLGMAALSVDTHARRVLFADGTAAPYDLLVSSIPLDVLLRMAAGTDAPPDDLTQPFVHSSSYIVGVGLTGQPPASLRARSWTYFPGEDCPFHRATVFSNYSVDHVPPNGAFWSLLTEISTPADGLDRSDELIDATIAGLVRTGMITMDHKIASTWCTRLEYGYPTPFLGRDAALAAAQAFLEKRGIFSRGRFGGWKFEVSDQDHAVLQGVEIVDRLVLGRRETTYPG